MKYSIAAALVSMITLADVAYADVWAEREALAKIRADIEALEVMVSDTENLSDTTRRAQFQYQRLLQDLHLIRSGITQHLSMPIEPHIPKDEQLDGHYTEKRP